MTIRQIKVGILTAALLTLSQLPAIAQDSTLIQPQIEIANNPEEQLSPETRLEIADILARMNSAIDREDYDEYITYFADTFTFDSGFGEPMSDEASLLEFLRQNQASGFIVGKRHVMSNLIFTESGDRVVAEYYLSVFERETTPMLVATAVIVDEFEQIDGEWCVVRHVTRVDPALFNVMEQGE